MILHEPEGVIREAQELAAEVFQAKKTYFLVNGTTCGNEAMVLASVKEGEKIMVARNAHKSVLMGLTLSGAVPVYLMPKQDPVDRPFGGAWIRRLWKRDSDNIRTVRLFFW